MQRALAQRHVLGAPGALDVIVAQYHAFLQLAKTTGREGLVPTVAVDLVWHTHQMHAERYGRECAVLAGSVLDHDDDASDDALRRGERATVGAWLAAQG